MSATKTVDEEDDEHDEQREQHEAADGDGFCEHVTTVPNGGDMSLWVNQRAFRDQLLALFRADFIDSVVAAYLDDGNLPRTVEFDPNVHVHGNLTYVEIPDGFRLEHEDVVLLVEPESGLHGYGVCVSVDYDSNLLYVALLWSKLELP